MTSPHLSSRLDAELHVLALLSAGLSNAEICERTGLPIRTVKAHLRRAATASGSRRRAEIARWIRGRLRQ